jgi:hypothetical protein
MGGGLGPIALGLAVIRKRARPTFWRVVFVLIPREVPVDAEKARPKRHVRGTPARKAIELRCGKRAGSAPTHANILPKPIATHLNKALSASPQVLLQVFDTAGKFVG